MGRARCFPPSAAQRPAVGARSRHLTSPTPNGGRHREPGASATLACSVSWPESVLRHCRACLTGLRRRERRSPAGAGLSPHQATELSHYPRRLRPPHGPILVRNRWAFGRAMSRVSPCMESLSRSPHLHLTVPCANQTAVTGHGGLAETQAPGAVTETRPGTQAQASAPKCTDGVHSPRLYAGLAEGTSHPTTRWCPGDAPGLRGPS